MEKSCYVNKYAWAATESKGHQKAILERDIGDFLMGQAVYTSGKDYPHAGWICVMPDNSTRVLDNDDIRLCW